MRRAGESSSVVDGKLITFDSVVSPLITKLVQSDSVFLSLTNWKLMIFGLALILTMRYKPEGLWPSERMREEMHEQGDGT